MARHSESWSADRACFLALPRAAGQHGERRICWQRRTVLEVSTRLRARALLASGGCKPAAVRRGTDDRARRISAAARLRFACRIQARRLDTPLVNRRGRWRLWRARSDSGESRAPHGLRPLRTLWLLGSGGRPRRDSREPYGYRAKSRPRARTVGTAFPPGPGD